MKLTKSGQKYTLGMCKYTFYFTFKPDLMSLPCKENVKRVWKVFIFCKCYSGIKHSHKSLLSLCLARAVAQNKAALLKLGITHVLNAAHSKRGSIGNQSFYGHGFVYCGIPADDSTHFDLDVYFQPAADFIHKALKTPDGKTPRGFFFTWIIIFLHGEF